MEILAVSSVALLYAWALYCVWLLIKRRDDQ